MLSNRKGNLLLNLRPKIILLVFLAFLVCQI